MTTASLGLARMERRVRILQLVLATIVSAELVTWVDYVRKRSMNVPATRVGVEPHVSIKLTGQHSFFHARIASQRSAKISLPSPFDFKFTTGLIGVNLI